MAPLRWLLFACLLSSCASARTTGLFIERPAPNAMRALAVGAAHQLGLLYPPAHTQLTFSHPTDDGFGRSLVHELRSLGFAVAELSGRGSQLSVAYVVDTMDSLYCILLRVTSARRKITLARAYTYRDNALRGAGPWTQQVGP